VLDHYPASWLDARSAGSALADELNLSIVAILGARGLDLTREFPKSLTDEMARD
jgi:protein-tyrosine-phosphatase